MTGNKKYRVILTPEERLELEQLINKGKSASRKLIHARILLKCDESLLGPTWTDEQIADALEISTKTVCRVREMFVEQGFSRALEHKKPIRSRPKKMDGEKEARLVALSCSQPPDGRKDWTLELLAEQLVELNVFESIAKETIRQTLKKTKLNRG